MNLQIMDAGCDGINQIIINQEQGDNTPIVINFPYDVTGVTFQGTINFPAPIALAIDSGITIDNIINCVGSISGNILTVSSVTYGIIDLGSLIAGNNILPNTFIVSLGTGSGGVGTYIVDQQQTVASTALFSSTVFMQLTPEQTQTVPEGQYPFDLWTIGIETPPVQTPILTGYFAITNAITVVT